MKRRVILLLIAGALGVALAHATFDIYAPVTDSNPLPITIVATHSFDPYAPVSDTNPKPLTIP